MALTAIGFDLDYTLAVPIRDRRTLLLDALEAVGAPPLETGIDREAYRAAHRRHLTAPTREPIFAELLAGVDADVDPAAAARAYRQRVNDALVPVPGVGPLLERLRREYRVGLLTNGPERAQYSKLEALGWRDRFDAVVVTGELAAGKPDGRAFRALLEALDSLPAGTAYVGDDVTADVEGAADAGLVPVQVRYPGGPECAPRAAACLRRARLAAELPGRLAGLGRAGYG